MSRVQSQGATAKGKGGDTGEGQAKGEEPSRFLWRPCGKIKYGKKIPYGDVYTMPRSRQYMPLIS